MKKIVLLRHGQSQWNLENKFTGWFDIDLTSKGESEATSAGESLKSEGFSFDTVHTSVLKRANRTMDICLDTMGIKDNANINYSWRLNERHYGNLQGLNKSEVAEKHGENQVLIWRRSYDIRPPELSKSSQMHPVNDPKYRDIDSNLLPSSECLKDTVVRILPLWENIVKNEVSSGKSVLIVAHGNSLRALVKHLDNISDVDILKLNIPTGIPLVYELNENLDPLRNYYLGDKKLIEDSIKTVESQGNI